MLPTPDPHPAVADKRDQDLKVRVLPQTLAGTDLTSTGGYVLDKVEGFAITPDGEGWVSPDNDGVDDHSGETMFFSIGQM